MFLFEVRPNGLDLSRHIELVGQTMTPRAATDSDQWLIQMERGLEDGYVRTYEEPPEKPIVDSNFNHDEFDKAHFTCVWKSARLFLEARTRRLALTGSCDGCRQTGCSPVACASRREPRTGPLLRLSVLVARRDQPCIPHSCPPVVHGYFLASFNAMVLYRRIAISWKEARARQL